MADLSEMNTSDGVFSVKPEADFSLDYRKIDVWVDRFSERIRLISGITPGLASAIHSWMNSVSVSKKVPQSVSDHLLFEFDAAYRQFQIEGEKSGTKKDFAETVTNVLISVYRFELHELLGQERLEKRRTEAYDAYRKDSSNQELRKYRNLLDELLLGKESFLLSYEKKDMENPAYRTKKTLAIIIRHIERSIDGFGAEISTDSIQAEIQTGVSAVLHSNVSRITAPIYDFVREKINPAKKDSSISSTRN